MLEESTDFQGKGGIRSQTAVPGGMTSNRRSAGQGRMLVFINSTPRNYPGIILESYARAHAAFAERLSRAWLKTKIAIAIILGVDFTASKIDTAS